MLLYNNAVEIDFGGSLIGTLVYIGLMIFLIASQWKMFRKAGEAGWKCLIPIYNIYIMCRIARRPKLFWKYIISSILVFISACVSIGGIIAIAGVGITSGELSGSGIGTFLIGMFLMLIFALALAIITCMLYFNIAKAFGQSSLFGIGMIFFAPIFIAIIAFNKNIQYMGYYEQPMRNIGPSGPNYYGNGVQNPYGYNNQYPYGQTSYNEQNQFGFNNQDPNNRNNY